MMELFILDPAYLHYRPSVIAVSAIFLALYTTHQNPWVSNTRGGFARWPGLTWPVMG